MAIYYVDNQNATSTSPFSTWATAARFISSIAQVDAAGDTVYVAARHAETTATATTWTWAGTSTAPTRIICADHTSGNPPTRTSTGASVSTTGAVNLIACAQASSFYCYGINFSIGTASTAADLTLMTAVGKAIYERCRFRLGAQNSGSDLFLNTGVGAIVKLIECTYEVPHANTALACNQVGNIFIEGGKTLSTTPNPFLESGANNTRFFISGLDCSSLINSFNFINGTLNSRFVKIRNCNLPDSWTGNVFAQATVPEGSEFELMNSDSADTNYRLSIQQPFGTIVHETTNVKTGGATDGTTPISWEVSSNTQPAWNHQYVESPEIVRWVTTVGSAVNVGVDILHDSTVAMSNRDIWVEIQYLGLSGRPLGFFATSATTYAGASTNYVASGATWDTTGLTNPNKQLISTSFTPQEVGFIHGVIKVAIPSRTVYIDPVLQILP